MEEKNVGGRPTKYGVKKTERLAMKLTPGLKKKMFRAAELAGRDLTSFWEPIFSLVSDEFIFLMSDDEITPLEFQHKVGERFGDWLIYISMTKERAKDEKRGEDEDDA